MPKDYANTKKGKSRKSPKEPAQSKRPRWLLLLTVVVTIIFASGLIILKLNHNQHVAKMRIGAPVVEHSAQYVRPLPQEQTQSHSANDHSSNPATADHQTEPRFEFYSTLTQKETPTALSTQQQQVMTQQQESSKHQTKTGTASKTAQTQHDMTKKSSLSAAYYVQLAAFARFRDADNLKGKLLLQGYKPAVKSKKVGDKTWYRVILGPFSSKQAAEKANKQLKKQGFHGLINHHSATT